jgi:hypothetical protein
VQRPLPKIPSAVVAVATFSLLAAACGSSASGPSSSAANPTPAQLRQAQQDTLRFVRCMRAHGVTNLPDPTTSPHAFKNAFNTHSPAFESAAIACRHLLPGGGRQHQSAARSRAQVAAMLAFARCVRAHGFPSFPDPTGGGELSHEMVASAGIDLHQPAVMRVGDLCTGVTHGIITKADVARFVAGR